MKNVICVAGLFLFLSGQFVYAKETLKFQCQWVAPSCLDLFSSGPGGDAGGIAFSGLLSPDVQVSATASLIWNDADRLTSTMEVQLFDATTHEPSPAKTFLVRENETVLGGVENFVASNGKSYTLLCEGSQLAEGENVWIPACQ